MTQVSLAACRVRQANLLTERRTAICGKIGSLYSCINLYLNTIILFAMLIRECEIGCQLGKLNLRENRRCGARRGCGSSCADDAWAWSAPAPAPGKRGRQGSTRLSHPCPELSPYHVVAGPVRCQRTTDSRREPDQSQEYPAPGGACSPRAARDSGTAMARPRTSITRLRNRKPQR